MLSKEKFKEYMEFLKVYSEKLHTAHNAVCDIEKDFSGIMGIASPIIDKYIYLLIDSMNLNEMDGELIWWWIYDCDWGKNHVKIYKGKKVIADLKDLDALYEYIKKCNKEM